MTRNVGDYYPKNINQHVTNMEYAADVMNSGDYLADLGTPPAADANFVLQSTSVSVSTAQTFTSLTNTKLAHKYGAAITLQHTASQVPGVTVTITGKDYLGQALTEQVTTVSTTAVIAGAKAFKYVDSVAYASATAAFTGAATGTEIGFAQVLGLPYRSMQIGTAELLDDVADTGGTLVAGLANSTTATSLNADTKGTYSPNTAPNGSRNFKVEVIVDRSNLHGNAAA